MILEALGSAVLGLILAWAAAHGLAHRLPARPLVYSTGVAGALFGDFVTRTALGPGTVLLSILGARSSRWRPCPCSCARRAASAAGH